MKPREHFPLSESALCQDCSEVGRSLSACTCCGSRSLLALAPLLNGRPQEPTAYDVERALWTMENANK
jgi:hypothetical protein